MKQLCEQIRQVRQHPALYVDQQRAVAISIVRILHRKPFCKWVFWLRHECWNPGAVAWDSRAMYLVAFWVAELFQKAGLYAK